MHATLSGPSLRFGFVMEQTQGNATYYKNLRAALDADPSIAATWYPLAFPPRGTLETLPLLRDNWSVRASTRTRRLLDQAGATDRHDVLFFHTQVTTLLSVGLMRRVPAVVSLDATPLNYDAVGEAYGHRRGGGVAEGLKKALNKRPLHAACALVTFCDWARRSLVADYDVDPARITVIPPGVNLQEWPAPAPRERTGLPRLLFVGGDFSRKGGVVLLDAFKAVLQDRCELHLVTKTPVAAASGVHVYHDVAPYSDLWKRLYAEADILVLPTLADCFPHVIQEAMAAGLPIVATDVGAISEAVREGETGLLVSPGDAQALGAALDALVRDGGRRRAMGAAGRKMAEQHFDSKANARRIRDLMAGLVVRPEQPDTAPLTGAARGA